MRDETSYSRRTARVPLSLAVDLNVRFVPVQTWIGITRDHPMMARSPGAELLRSHCQHDRKRLPSDGVFCVFSLPHLDSELAATFFMVGFPQRTFGLVEPNAAIRLQSMPLSLHIVRARRRRTPEPGGCTNDEAKSRGGANDVYSAT
jgi:hypothetical protein